MSAFAAALALLLLGALASAAAPAGSRAALRCSAGAVLLASALCGALALRVLASGESLSLALAWPVPGGALALGLDPLSAFFALPVALLAGASACAALAEPGAGWHASRAGPPAFALLVAGMLAVPVARSPLLFVAAWEAMSLAAWPLVAGDSRSAEARRAGWIYGVASHAGTAALLLLFAVLAEGGVDLSRAGSLAGARLALPPAALLGLALVGFGVKAGVLPLHVWLAEAHAAAPPHVSALMSGALVKLGLYGLLRVAWLAGPLPAGAGALAAGLGLAGALLGIGLALQQRDLKRALACSSVENLGLALFGLGLAAWAQARGAPALAALALAGALLHVWNHALLKGLLFLCAGALVHAVGTRDLERLGGLLRRMPWVGACALLGALGLAGLPPLNGFAGEWLLVRALLAGALAASGAAQVALLGAVAALAALAALAAACWLRLVGVALLGEPRSAAAARARDPGRAALAPLLCLSLLCVGMGVAPAAALALARSAGEALLGAAAAPELAAAARAAAPAGAFGALLWGLGALAALWGRRALRGAAAVETWACGYAAPEPRMQYSARSFSQPLAQQLWPALFAPRVEGGVPPGPFPGPARWSAQTPDPLLHSGFEPLFAALAARCVRLRVLQRGRTHLYLAYILAALLGSLLWLSLRGAAAP